MTTAVAVALYNGARFLETQLDSLRLQSRTPDRVVLCDDGSTDGTADLVAAYIAKHGLGETWELSRNPENLGYIRNFYRAISLCDADLIFLSDQDDVWKSDKIEKMTAVMEANPHISLLSCRYGIIDAAGEEQHSLVEGSANEDGGLEPVTVQTIMTAYRWPGMLMCLRKDFFDTLLPAIAESPVPHDLMFAACAADRDSFYEYHYLGAYHRRHDNNVAKEEHRIFKLLDLQRKLTDIARTRKHWTDLLHESTPIGESSRRIIAERLALHEKREKALRDRSLSQILRLYREDKGVLLRKLSLVCDVWLVCFGKYKNN